MYPYPIFYIYVVIKQQSAQVSCYDKKQTKKQFYHKAYFPIGQYILLWKAHLALILRVFFYMEYVTSSCKALRFISDTLTSRQFVWTKFGSMCQWNTVACLFNIPSVYILASEEGKL